MHTATETRQDLIASMGAIQNHPLFQSQDIMTFCGFLSNEEIRRSIEQNFEAIARFNLEAAADVKPARKARAKKAA
ncbi:hypothetical protein UFOVP1349_18 [uncultured Caudovirales phage]|uniref:Uncharacterized protein n=1 Tax=uncultured Caudovirales phage TaxID=2100421 RepID=A0A6J5PNZ9_9CAUD|nr:hypothetical protein UFOVP925_25 [uncultured Caudovirales phage]CAB4184082.1 hypothetical protein UFOVP1097_24 [uncultured Caudovirales phage]CAB4199901.1 hypothetical protein UFOVP1349_18 [uncultured Caudovirales phage]CAB4214644.1 hypothetical protein UFOVP1456_55 [uncultured Caudovirales phage]